MAVKKILSYLQECLFANDHIAYTQDKYMYVCNHRFLIYRGWPLTKFQ